MQEGRRCIRALLRSCRTRYRLCGPLPLPWAGRSDGRGSATCVGGCRGGADFRDDASATGDVSRHRMNQSKPDWYRTFFSGPVLDVVRNLFPPQVTAAEVDFIATRLAEPFPPGVGANLASRLPTGAKLLDVPCGAGRHALDLAARGYEV